ncbi:MAG: ABC transporter substrate-binding protein [Anaerolineales bacterium]|nr:ABC transporter substrate-binding protein [Anaerolineales bacterium]
MKEYKRFLLNIALLLVFLVGITGCSTPTEVPPAATKAPTVAAPEATEAAPETVEETVGEPAVEEPSGEPIKIGAALSLTGYLAMEKFHAEAAQMAVDYVNEHGGVLGRPLEFFMEDVKSDPAQCAIVVTKHIVQNEADIIIAGASSAGNEAAAPIAEENEVPMIINSVLPSNPAWAVSTLPSVNLFIQTEFQYLASIGVTEVGDIHNPTPYNQFMVSRGMEVGESLGISFVASEEVAADSTTMVIPLTNINEKNPGAVVSFVSGGPTALVGKDMAALGMTIPLMLTSDDLSNLTTAAEAYDNVYFPVMPVQTYPDVPDPEMKANLDAFMPIWEEVHPGADALYAAAGWDQIMIAVKVIEQVGSVDGKAIMEALEQFEYVGVEAVYKFTPDDHMGVKDNPLRVGQWKNGELEIVFVPK